MATVKVKLRPSSVPGMAGTVYYRIIHNRIARHIATDIHLSVAERNVIADLLPAVTADPDLNTALGAAPVPDAGSSAMPTGGIIRHRINGDMALLRRIIVELDGCGRRYSAADVVRRYHTHGGQTGILHFIRMQIERLNQTGRLGTAQCYEKTLHSFALFLGGKDLPLSAMTEQLVSDYNTFLIRRGLVRNSVSFYMRVLRAVYNKAVRQRLIEQSHPFQTVYTGIDRTRKRAVDEGVISALNRLELSADSRLALARDMFLFSYCTRGMAFVDMAYLRRDNIQNGMICYARRKTGQRLVVRIEPSIRRIIDRYAAPERPYLFPVVTSTDTCVAYAQYRAAMNTYNRMLLRLSAMLPEECRLTSYTSRHSWATAARNHNVPISVISAGMGHSSEQTTRIYLAMLENSVIDDANSVIIGCLE